MKEAILTGLKAMEIRDVPDPVINGDTDVLLDVGTVGVCGSDIHYYTTGRIGSLVVEHPFRVGHEFAAIVREVGSGVQSLKPGDRVAVDPAMPCYECDQCLSGRTHTCRRLLFLGCPGQAAGCLSEKIVMPEGSCVLIEADMPLEIAALIEPLSIGLYSVQESIPMQNARIAILGCGPIGLSVLACARALGAEKVYATDRLDYRVETARRAGADWGGNPDGEDIVATIAAHEPLRLDAVFECCGEQDAIDQAVQLLKPGGMLVLVGIPAVDRISFEIDMIRRQELTIQNIRRQNECVRPAIDLVQQGAIDPGFMITHRFPLEKTQEAFDLVEGYRDGVVKAMIEVGPDR